MKKYNRVDWIAFLCALVLAPIIVAILGFWALIPLLAPLFGTPTYVLFGAPAFYLALRRSDAGPVALAVVAFAAHVVSIPAVHLYVHWADADPGLVEIIFVFGSVMAPIWGVTFGLLYRVFEMPEE